MAQKSDELTSRALAYLFGADGTDVVGKQTIAELARLPFVYGATPHNLRHMRKGLARVRAGLGGMKILCTGDSTTDGSPSTLEPTSWPSFLVKILKAAGIDAHSNSFFGTGSAASLLTFDTRITYGAGWGGNAGTTSLGGPCLANTTTTNSLSFTPAESVDTFRIRYAVTSGGGTFTINIDGSAPSTGSATVNSNGTKAIAEVTVTAASLAAHTINIQRNGTGAGIYIFSIEAWDSAKLNTQISVCNAGWGGSTAANWGVKTDPWNTGLAVPAFGADLVIHGVGINDFNASVDLTAFQASQAGFLADNVATRSVVLSTPLPCNPATGNAAEAVQRQYGAATIAACLSGSGVCSDMQGRYEDFATLFDMGYSFDGRHINPLGNADYAKGQSNIIVTA